MKRAPFLVGVIVLSILVAAMTRASQAASNSVDVGMTVPSTTSLDVTGCDSDQSDRTQFGTVLPGTSRVTSLDCVVLFGSSNAPSTLQLSQFDGSGRAMYAPTLGQREETFSGDGVFSTPVGTGTAADHMNGALSTSDGRLVMIGTCDMGATGLDVCLIRLNADGTLDTTFDGDGIRSLAIGPGSNLDYGIAVEEVASGKLLVASQCFAGTTGLDHCLARLLPDGSLDPAFGSGGIQVRNFVSTHDFVRDLHVLPNGSFLVGGDCEDGAAGRSQCVARYLPDGTLDTSFGSGGLASHLPGGKTPAHDSQLLATADGSIVMASACYVDAVTDFDYCLSRFESDGALDTTFGSGGSVLVAPSAGYDSISSLVELGDGRLIAGGSCDRASPTTGWDTCLVRYAANGTPDPSFGTGGLSRIGTSPGAGDDTLAAVFDEGTGGLLVVGGCASAATGGDFCAYRTTANGSLDAAFGTGGVVVHPVAPGAGVDGARNALALEDGRVLIFGGCAMPTTGQDACAIVLDSAGSMDQYDPGTADWTTTDTGHFAACLLTSGTSTASWPTSPSCPASNGTFWKAVPAAREGVATAPSGTTNASANFRFGLRVAPGQPPGTYTAPIGFTVVAT